MPTTIAPYPATLSDRELMHLGDIAKHPDTPRPLRECLCSMGRPEMRRRLLVCNEGFTPPEVEAATIDASGWSLAEVADSVASIYLRLGVLRLNVRPDRPVIDVLERAVLHLLVVLKSKARAAERGPTAPR